MKIVQFTHPGGEANPTNKEIRNGIKEWNYGSHKRKFMKARGQYVVDVDTLSSKEDLLFWGEWEPTSKIQSLKCSKGAGVLPQYVHEPFLQKNSNNILILPTPFKGTKLRQNTDPFIFGDYFLYSCCKQRKKSKKTGTSTFTQLGRLAKGSIILFGSTISAKNGGPYFVLDTVFVVSECKKYNPHQYKNHLRGFVPSNYGEIMGFDHWKSNDELICYKGATFKDPVDGMYSFVPCKQATETTGFPRVILTQEDLDFISENLNAAPKYTDIGEDSKKIWDEIYNILKRKGYKIGVNFDYIVEDVTKLI